MFNELTTTNATPATLASYVPSKAPPMTASFRSQASFAFEVVASAADGTAAAFFVRGAVKFTPASGMVGESVALVGTPEVTSFKDAGAASWDVGVSVVGSELRLDVTGDAGVLVDWHMPHAHVTHGASDAQRLSWTALVLDV